MLIHFMLVRLNVQANLGNKLTLPTNQYLYVDYRAHCTAVSSKGYQFNSWNENLGNNSTRTVSAFTPSNSPIEYLLDVFSLESKNQPETLIITSFSNLTANFEKTPTPIPPVYLATLFSVIITAFVGTWLTPTFISWIRTKRQNKLLSRYYIEIQRLYEEDGKLSQHLRHKKRLDQSDLSVLDKLKTNTTSDYTQGKITKNQYDTLVEEISASYWEIFNKEIDTLSKLSDKSKNLDEIRENIEYAFARGKINEQHYKLLNTKMNSI